MIKTFLLYTLLLGVSLCLLGWAGAYETVGQASVFWRDGEWQVYKDGHWIPYAQAKVTDQAQVFVPAPPLEPPLVDTNAYGYDGDYAGGYGYGLPLWGHTGHRRISHIRASHSHSTQNLNDRAVGNIGRTTIGIGQQSGAIGRQFVR